MTGDATMVGRRPNVVVLLTDQWRGDCLSTVAHPVVQTPYLDQLAVEGVRFDRCYSATPTCIPARAALYTGLRQRSHGRVGYRDEVPWDYPTTIASEFTRNGYQTEAVGKLHVYPERSQLGFQHVTLHDGFLHSARAKPRDIGTVDDYVPWLRAQTHAGADYFDHGVTCNSVVARPWGKAEHLHPTNWVTTMGIDFLRRRDTRKPFFLMLSYHRPHPPYDPPGWSFDQYAHRSMPDPPVGDWAGVYAPYATGRADPHVGPIDPRLLHRARAGYYGHMTHIDQQINRFVESCREYGVFEDTIFVFTSDHGEMLGDHHLFRKGYPYEGSARVPLILSAPGRRCLPPGVVLSPVVELRDVLPTVLDLAGLPVPDVLDGQSLVPLVHGAATEVREYLHGEHTLFGQSVQWLTDGRTKYVWMSGDGTEQLFDLCDDPTETHDLSRAGAHGATLARWRGRLVSELAEREEGFVDDGRLVTGRPVSPTLSCLG